MTRLSEKAHAKTKKRHRRFRKSPSRDPTPMKPRMRGAVAARMGPPHPKRKPTMSPSSNKSKMSRQDRLRKIVSGTEKHSAPGDTFTLAGTKYTPTQFVAFCTRTIAVSDAAVRARAAWLTAVQTERDESKQAAPVLRAYKAYVTAFYGDSPKTAEILADYGYAPRKVPVRDVAVRNLAADKMRATREARHTLS